MKTQLLAEINSTFDIIPGLFAQLDENKLDVVPFEGSWTAGQVAEHMIRAVGNLPEFMSKDTEPANRPADEKVMPIRNLFLDLSTK